jgi:uncharacterized protein (TIGR03083 family)
MDGIDYVAHLRADTERFLAALERGPRDAPVAACPGWDLKALAVHLGGVHRWAAVAAAQGRAPERGEVQRAPEEPAALAGWMREGADGLATTLAGLDPDAPTWHPFPAPQLAGLWPRRQAQETVVHRWDAEQAVGDVTPIDPVLASDGVDEYFEVMLPRRLERDGPPLPSGSLHVHCTDTPGEWTVRIVDGALAVERAHAKGDAALRGPAEALLLRLWGRPQLADAVEVIGDAAVADQWLALGGA